MNQMTSSMKSFPWGGFSAVFVTALLFTALPLMTRIQVDRPVKTPHPPVFIDIYKPPPPPTEEKTQREEPKMIEKDPPKSIDKPQRAKPKFEVTDPSFAANRGRPGYIEFRETPQTEVTFKKTTIAFNPNEVDQPPRYLRTAPAQYPYLAKRDSIEGKVLLRFVVDLDGLAKEAEVVKAEPAGIFEEAALKAIERYKFKPAVKDGKAVMCNAALVITFVLD